MSPRRRRAPSDEIRVRMYRVGFGDCFLVTFPGPEHVLVDCGVHNRGDIGTLDQILDDIEEQTGAKLAIVIASHAHEDHIAGYARGAELFRRFTINEVWLPWSENRGDPVARGLWARLASLHAALELKFQLAGGKAPDDVIDILANTSAARNEPTLANLRSGLGTNATVAFLEAGGTRTDAGRITGLTARILGPTRDESFLRKMDPPKAERFPAASADGTISDTGILPFGQLVAPDATPILGPRLTESQQRELIRAVELSPESLAFALDRAINNLSIVALFMYRGKHLLFAGDSQYGGWKSWLDLPDSGDLLGEVSFYKVAHHGSENATPKSALDAMGTAGMTAMLSTQNSPWPSIPDTPLMNALTAKTANRVLRSDSIAIVGAPPGPGLGDVPDGFTVGPFWVDHHISL